MNQKLALLAKRVEEMKNRQTKLSTFHSDVNIFQDAQCLEEVQGRATKIACNLGTYLQHESMELSSLFIQEERGGWLHHSLPA